MGRIDPRNTWQKRFGAKRRAIDRALLAEVEQQIAIEEINAAIEKTISDMDAKQARERIAKAFGRTV